MVAQACSHGPGETEKGQYLLLTGKLALPIPGQVQVISERPCLKKEYGWLLRQDTQADFGFQMKGHATHRSTQACSHARTLSLNLSWYVGCWSEAYRLILALRGSSVSSHNTSGRGTNRVFLLSSLISKGH